MVTTRSHDQTSSTDDTHAIAAKSPTTTTRKRKAQPDKNSSKKEVGLKRRRRDSETAHATDLVILTRDEHLNGTAQPPSKNPAAGSSVQRVSHVALEEQDDHDIGQVRQVRAGPAETLTDKRNESSDTLPKASPRLTKVDDILKEDALPRISPETHENQGNDFSMEKPASNSGYESEDEAPETVSVATGLLQSRQAAADVAKADETQVSPQVLHYIL